LDHDVPLILMRRRHLHRQAASDQLWRRNTNTRLQKPWIIERLSNVATAFMRE
jgi:hypothetical protein